MAAPIYAAAASQPAVGDVGAVLFSSNLQSYTPQTIPGFGATGADTVDDLFYDGKVVITASYERNVGLICTWDSTNGWAIRVHKTDGTLYGGFGETQPRTGPFSIASDGTAYVIGGNDANGNSIVVYSTDHINWTQVELDSSGTFDGVSIIKWVPRLMLYVAIGDSIWSAPAGGSSWAQQVAGIPNGGSIENYFKNFYDDGTTLWVSGENYLWSSNDGLTWTQNSYPTLGGFSSPNTWMQDDTAQFYWDNVLELWVGLSGVNKPHVGILWATSMLGPWTYGSQSADAAPRDFFYGLVKFGSTMYVGGQILNSMGGSDATLLATSTDDKTWTINQNPTGLTANGRLNLLFGSNDGLTLATEDGHNNYYSLDSGVTWAIGGTDFWLQIIEPPTPPPPPAFNDYILLYYLGRNRGWTRLVEPLAPGGPRLTTIKEIQTAAGGTGAWPLAGNGDYAMLALGDDSNSYVLFAGAQDGSITATCVTQPLPPPADLPIDLRNSRKIFHSIWVEGEDLGNWQVFFATDVQFDATGIPISYPYGPMSIINNKVDMEIQAKQIVIKFVHSAASANGVTPLLSYINLDYDILAESN